MTAIKVVRFLGGTLHGNGPYRATSTQSSAACGEATSLPEVLRDRWERVLATDGAGERQPPGRPSRVALGVPLELADLPPPPFAAVDVQWFPDVEAALANGAWLAVVDEELGLGSRLLGEGSCQVVAEEVVLRGQQYLAARWEAGGERYKMLSFGKRSPRLTQEEFSARWRAEAGRLGGAEIPVEVRGLAYAQNHPVPVEGHEWPFDAVNEVWFERLDHLLQRRTWFAARQDAALQASSQPFMDPARVGSMLLRELPLT